MQGAPELEDILPPGLSLDQWMSMMHSNASWPPAPIQPTASHAGSANTFKAACSEVTAGLYYAA